MKDNEMMKLRSTKFSHCRESTHFISSSLKELELYERYSPRHPSCHQLRSEQVEVEGMDMPEVEGVDIVEEQDHPMNHRLGEEGMNMVGINMVEMDDMDTVEEQFHSMNHGPKVEGMDTVDTGMEENRWAELEVAEREPKGMVLVRHWTGDGAARHR
jgi:hypothetical protein